MCNLIILGRGLSTTGFQACQLIWQRWHATYRGIDNIVAGLLPLFLWIRVRII